MVNKITSEKIDYAQRNRIWYWGEDLNLGSTQIQRNDRTASRAACGFIRISASHLGRRNQRCTPCDPVGQRVPTHN